MQIKEIDYGIACRIGDKIYINRKLKEDVNLWNAIIRHEKSHSSGFERKDIWFDIYNEEIQKYQKEYYTFILKHPSTWVEFLPCWMYENKIVWNPMMTIYWFMVLVLIIIMLRI